MKNKILLAIITIALVFGMTACSNGGGGGTPPEKTTPAPGTATYVSTDTNGNRYTLEITEKVNARYVAKPNDTFKLTVELYKSGDYEVALVYKGTVSSAVNNNTEVKISITVNGKPLNITIKGVEMTVIEGEIVNENGQPVVTAPGSSLSTVFVSITALGDWLASQPDNTYDKPYTVKLNVSSFGEDLHYWDNGERVGLFKYTLRQNITKYISLDLSDSTMTSIGELFIWRLNNIKSVTIPNSVTRIEKNSFENDAITAINANAANKDYSSQDGILYNKEKTTLIRYPAGKTGETFTIPDSVKNIGPSSFLNTSLKSITINNNVTSISEMAFAYCLNLTSITIPSSVSSIYHGTFTNTGLTSSL